MEIINSRQNSKVTHAKKLGKSRSYRTQNSEFLCDGSKLLLEAIHSGIKVVSIFTISEPEITLPDDISIYITGRDIIDSISPINNAQDTLFICKTPPSQPVNFHKGIHVLLDNVQDPGNVGTIIRSADAFGIESVVLAGACADPFNPKAIRASTGAIFRQKLVFVTDAGVLRKTNARFIGTAKNDGHTPVSNVTLMNSVIVLGNEGQGISNELSALCGEMITIPVAPCCESLNVAVAASIIMWEASKQKTDERT